MSARACQLCGKQLSRFSVGTDGDFCSREHRNQYRLRQGMGRLQEANQVATVMRRREQLRPLTGVRQGASPEMQHRGCFRLPFPAAQPRLADVPISLRRPPLRVNTPADHFVPPPPAKSARVAVAKSAPAAPMSKRRQPVVKRAKAPAQPGRMQQAPPFRGRKGSSGLTPTHREFGLAMPKPRPPVPGRRPDAKPTVKLPGGRTTGNRFKFTPVRGTTLRVSSACGFRPRPLRRTFPKTPGRFHAELRWCEGTTKAEARRPQKPERRLVNGIAIPVGGIYCPAPPAQPAAGPQPQRRPRAIRRPAPMDGARLKPRAAEKELQLQSTALVLREPILEPWRPGSISGTSHISTKPSAIAGRGASQHLLVTFVPQEMSRDFSFSVGQNGSKDQKR